MGNIRKAIASLSLVAILSTLVVTTTAFAAFSDVPGDHWAANTISKFVDEGVVAGNPDGTFAPNRPIVRAEVAKVLALAANLELQDGASCSDRFPDCPSDQWYAPYIVTMNMMDIIRGNANGEAMPGVEVNRADLLVMLHRLQSGSEMYKGSSYFSDVPAGTYYDTATGWGYCYGVVSGYADGTYRPGNSASRAEAVVMIERGLSGGSLIAACSDDDDTPVVTPPVTPTGDLTVKVSASSPARATVPSNATAVEMAAWDFTAGDKNAVVQSLTVQKIGVSAVPSGHQVYIYHGDERLTSGRSINSTTREASFNNLNVKVDKGETVTLSLRMDIGTVLTAGEIGFQLKNSQSVTAAGAVSGSFPLTGSMLDLSATAAGTITVQKNGTVPNPKVGEDDVVISKFRMTTATEAANLEQLSVYITGNVNASEVENLRLYVAGQDAPLAEVASVNGQDLAVFSGIDYTLGKGDTRTFEVKADLNTGRAGDEIKVYIDESSDIRAIGDIYKFGMQVDATAYDGTACTVAGLYADCTQSTVEGGDITITSGGPAATDIAIAGNDVVLMNFTITAIADTVFRNFPISLQASEDAGDDTEGLLNGTEANFTDIRIVNRDTGATVLGPVDSDVFRTALGGNTAITEATDAGTAFYIFTDEFEMKAGQELNLALTLDVQNTSTLDGMTILSRLELGAVYPEMRDVNNKVVTNSSTLVPASSIAGKTMTVRAPALTVSRAAVPVSNTYVKGSKNVPFLGISMQCGSSSDCEVQDFTLTGSIDDDNDGVYGVGQDADGNETFLNEYVGSLRLEDAQGNVVSSKSVPSSGVINFNNLKWNLDAGQTQLLYVVGDISSDAYKNNSAERITFAVAAATDITYVDNDGNTRNATGTVNTARSTVVTTAEAGGLSIAVNGNTPKETVLVAGTTGNELAKYEMSATNESFKVTKLSLTARQQGVADADLGQYANNLSAVYLTYTNSNGVEQVVNGSLSNGVAAFEGLDLYVPKDSDSTLTVSADMNTIQLGATSGARIELAVSLDNFEAVAQSSGETYNASRFDANYPAGARLDIGAITWVDSTADVEGAPAQIALGATTTLTYDTGAGANANVTFPVGTLLCTSEGDAVCGATNEIFVVVSDTTVDGLTDIVTVRLLDNGVADVTTVSTVVNGANILYALPTQGYLTAVKESVIYKTKPTLTLNANSPSGVRSTNANDTIYRFDVKADSKEKVTVRSGLHLTTCVAADGTTLTSAANTNVSIDGSSCELTALNAANRGAYFVANANLTNYAYASFWARWNDDSAAVALPADDLKVGTAEGTGAPDQATTLTAANLGGSGTTTFVEGVWTFVHSVAIPAGTDADDLNIGVYMVDAVVADDALDDLYIDQFKVYNDKVLISLSSDGSMTEASTGQAALLKGGTNNVTGYIHLDSESAGLVAFIPTDGNLDTASGATTNYSVETNTTTLITDQAGQADLLTPSITFGSSTDGTVSAGGFWWYDNNNGVNGSPTTTIKWTGYEANSNLSGNTLSY